jgi:hypothetical protein
VRGFYLCNPTIVKEVVLHHDPNSLVGPFVWVTLNAEFTNTKVKYHKESAQWS